MANPALQGLKEGRNRNLNDAFTPPWDQTDAMPLSSALVPQGDTNFDPFMGTPWGRFLDAMGASEPGGVRIGAGSLRGLSNSPIVGLQSAAPVVQSGPYGAFGVGTGGVTPGDPTGPGATPLNPMTGLPPGGIAQRKMR